MPSFLFHGEGHGSPPVAGVRVGFKWQPPGSPMVLAMASEGARGACGESGPRGNGGGAALGRRAPLLDHMPGGTTASLVLLWPPHHLRLLGEQGVSASGLCKHGAWPWEQTRSASG